MDTLIILIALGLLYVWARDHAKAHAARVTERQEHCPHKPEWQQTIRVNSILTINPALIHRVLPGRRWLKKHCRGCDKQWDVYAPTLQPFDEFVAEFDQETIDRAAQLQARTQAHMNDKAQAERLRQKKRDRG